MANAKYDKWGEQIIQGTASALLNGSGTTGVYVALVDTGVYTFSQTHEFYSSISSAVIGTPVELTSKTYTGGVLDAADSTFTAVPGTTSIEALVFYVKNAGANTTWRLIEYQDTGVTGLPVTSNGGDIAVTWNASGIFKI